MENSIINDWGIDPGFLILGLAIMTLILFITVIICLIKMSQLYRRYDIFMRGKDAETLEDLIITQIITVTNKINVIMARPRIRKPGSIPQSLIILFSIYTISPYPSHIQII